MSQTRFPKKQTWRQSLVFGVCIKVCPWDTTSNDESSSGQREKVRVMRVTLLQQQPWAALQGVLDLEWPFGVVQNWAETS